MPTPDAPNSADPHPHLAPPLYLTADLPPVGGRIKERPEDFLVDEIPAYDPVGHGEHIAMLVQKRDLSTMELVAILAKHFGVMRNAVGYAGLKDKHALTRQMITIHAPGKTPEDFPSLQHDRISILWTDLHTNKLRPGHLKGNRFSIRIRGVRFQDALTAKRVLDRLHARGVPNRVAEQRFGMMRNNHLLGKALILGDFSRFCDLLLGPCPARPDLNPDARAAFARGELAAALDQMPHSARTERDVLRALVRGRSPRHAVLSLDRSVLGYYISAFQSAAFNAVLDERIRDATFDQLLLGDLAFKHDNGAVFDATPEVLADASTGERLARLEISPSGPMFGPRMPRPTGRAATIEHGALDRAGVTPEQLAEFAARAPDLMPGERRPLRVPLIQPEVEGGSDEHGPYIRVAFELPRGSFATAVLPEIMKNSPPPDAPHDD